MFVEKFEVYKEIEWEFQTNFIIYSFSLILLYKQSTYSCNFGFLHNIFRKFSPGF